MTDTRTRLAKHVSATPGVHFNRLVEQSGLAPGQVQYHLRRLRADKKVRQERLYGKTHYYPPEYDDRERRTLALLRRETAREILCYLLEHETARPMAIADHLDIARSTLEWQLDRLVEQGLVEKRYDERNRVRLSLADSREIARLLRDVAPSLADRMADRFVRLTDRLLETIADTDRRTNS
ncbi:ArsR family transcriptional regulator [Halobacteriales archaeon QS_3_64_16]|nr:MAG: ArsR family transcriptional regulator [Halobacteriales archaeon QS_3_64_16]